MIKTENMSRIDRLASDRHLPKEDYLALIQTMTDEEDVYLASRALAVRESVYGKKVFIRGLIEISNICKNDCYYCGIRASNKNCDRYRLPPDDILACCDEGSVLGFRTFVIQGGEDGYFTDERLVPLITEIKSRYPDCAVTLSLGERSVESYAALRNAGLSPAAGFWGFSF